MAAVFHKQLDRKQVSDYIDQDAQETAIYSNSLKYFNEAYQSSWYYNFNQGFGGTEIVTIPKNMGYLYPFVVLTGLLTPPNTKILRAGAGYRILRNVKFTIGSFSKSYDTKALFDKLFSCCRSSQQWEQLLLKSCYNVAASTPNRFSILIPLPFLKCFKTGEEEDNNLIPMHLLGNNDIQISISFNNPLDVSDDALTTLTNHKLHVFGKDNLDNEIKTTFEKDNILSYPLYDPNNVQVLSYTPAVGKSAHIANVNMSNPLYGMVINHYITANDATNAAAYLQGEIFQKLIVRLGNDVIYNGEDIEAQDLFDLYQGDFSGSDNIALIADSPALVKFMNKRFIKFNQKQFDSITKGIYMDQSLQIEYTTSNNTAGNLSVTLIYNGLFEIKDGSINMT